MSSDFAQILYKVRERIAIVTLNRPEKLNAWTPTMEREFRLAVEAAERDPEVVVIVVTGAGRGFCAGADLSPESTSAPRVPLPRSEDDFDQRYSYLLAIQKPLIAAINGAVAGVAFAITLYCDLRYMAAGAKLTTAFARRGLVAEHGSAWQLPRLIGTMNALDLLMTGRVVPAEEAAAMGLVRVLPADGFLDHVLVQAAHFLPSSPRSMAVVKAQVYGAPRETLADATWESQLAIEAAAASADCAEGIASFREKRSPRFPDFQPFQHRGT